jgi:hypothetical protein
MVYALERESNLGSTFAVLIELPEGRDVSSGPVSRVRNLTSNGLPLDQPLQRDGPRRTRGSQQHATLEPMEKAILVLRAKHPSWAARKLKARLEMLQPELVWPAASTFGNILSRAGLTSPQRRGSAPRHAQSRSLWSLARINCGAWISRATSQPATASDAIRLPSPTRIAVI